MCLSLFHWGEQSDPTKHAVQHPGIYAVVQRCKNNCKNGSRTWFGGQIPDCHSTHLQANPYRNGDGFRSSVNWGRWKLWKMLQKYLWTTYSSLQLQKAAQQLLRENIDQFVGEVTEAIREGKVPPKSKVPELIPRVATALHVFNHTMEGLLMGVPASPPPNQISKSTLENATEFIQNLECQKSILWGTHNGIVFLKAAINYLLLSALCSRADICVYFSFFKDVRANCLCASLLRI